MSDETQSIPRVSPEITEAQKEAFFKTFLADQLYQETFELLGGNFVIVIRSISMEENADILKQIAYDRVANRISPNDDYYLSRVSHYRLGISLVSINDKPFAEEITRETKPGDSKTGTSYVSERADLLAKWPMVKLAAVQTKMGELDQRVLSLLDSVSNRDFWKAGA